MNLCPVLRPLRRSKNIIEAGVARYSTFVEICNTVKCTYAEVLYKYIIFLLLQHKVGYLAQKNIWDIQEIKRSIFRYSLQSSTQHRKLRGLSEGCEKISVLVPDRKFGDLHDHERGRQLL